MAIKYLEYDKTEVVQPVWLWPGFIREGKVALITGEGGVGKSTLSYKLIAAVTTGSPLPGQEEATIPPSFCIVQNSEDEPREDTLPQLRHFGADTSKVRSIEADGEPLGTLAAGETFKATLPRGRHAITLHSLAGETFAIRDIVCHL